MSRPLPEPGTKLLAAAGIEVEQHPHDRPPTREELLAGLRGKEALLCLLTERVDADVLDAAPDLRVVANLAVGYDNIDVAAATARGVVVTNTPDVLTEATAELTWALILAAARRIVEGDRLVRSNQWKGWSPTQLLGMSLTGKTLGIFGMGKIGAAVAPQGARVRDAGGVHEPHTKPCGRRRDRHAPRELRRAARTGRRVDHPRAVDAGTRAT